MPRQVTPDDALRAPDPSPSRNWRRRSLLLVLAAALIVAGDLPTQARQPTRSLASIVVEKVVQSVEAVAEFAQGLLPAPPPPPGPLTIDPDRELVIRDITIVDSERTRGNGPWSIGRLLRNAAPQGVDPADFTERLFQTWMAAMAANPHDFYTYTEGAPDEPDPQAAADRLAGMQTFFGSWPRGSDGKLDLDQAPFRLLGIVNRLDIHEGRLSFGAIVNQNLASDEQKLGQPLDLTMIFEYDLPSQDADGTPQDAAWWANAWHDLARFPIHSPQFRDELERLTNRFTGRDAAPDRPNGSALKAIRTNEQIADVGAGFDVDPVWQGMGFRLSPETGEFVVERLPNTPHLDYEAFRCDDVASPLCQQTLIDYLVANGPQIVAGGFEIDPNQIELAIYAPEYTPAFRWLKEVDTPDGLTDDEWEAIRFGFSSQTCNGCHSGDGNDNDKLLVPNEFQQLSHRKVHKVSKYSPYLAGQIRDVRIPNLLSYLDPGHPLARRADPRKLGVH